MPLLGISQNAYPSKSVIGSDTVVVFSLKQAWAIDSSLIQLDACKEFSDTLRAVVKRKNFAISSQQNVLTNCNEQLVIGADMIKGQDLIILDYKKVYKKNERQIKWLKLQRNCLVVTAIVLAAKVFLFH